MQIYKFVKPKVKGAYDKFPFFISSSYPSPKEKESGREICRTPGKSQKKISVINKSSFSRSHLRTFLLSYFLTFSLSHSLTNEHH